MAPLHALVALLTLASTAFAQLRTTTSDDDLYETSSTKTSMFWTYTSAYVATVTIDPYTYSRYSSLSVHTYTSTTTRAIKPTVTPTVSPTSTSTSYYSVSDMKVIYAFYPPGAVAESDLVPARDISATRTSTSMYTSIKFYMPVTMSAPASCPTPFTVTTSATVDVPSQVWPQIKPTSTVDGSQTTLGSGNIYSYQTWYLTAGAAPFTSSSAYDYRYYIRSCSKPPASRSTGTSSNGGISSDISSDDYCYGRYSYLSCGSSFKIWIIVIASVIPGLFLLGFLESWFWFRRLMRGKSAIRCGTCCWVLISLWVLCFTRMQDARSKEDQVVLAEKWKAMGSGAAFKAWLKWGFRHRYPVEHLGQYSKLTVGIVPEGQPLHPAMAQGVPQGYMPGAPAPIFYPGAPGAPAQHGQMYYYGPPPGWVPTPDGQGYMPPQGYSYPTPQQAGYYGAEVAKERSLASSSPVSALAPQQQQPPVPHTGPSPVPHVAQPMPPPGTATSAPPPPPAAAAAATAPHTPPTNVSEAPANPVTSAPSPPAAAAAAPQLPPVNVSEAPANPAPPAPKNDAHDRDLYE